MDPWETCGHIILPFISQIIPIISLSLAHPTYPATIILIISEQALFWLLKAWWIGFSLITINSTYITLSNDVILYLLCLRKPEYSVQKFTGSPNTRITVTSFAIGAGVKRYYSILLKVTFCLHFGHLPNRLTPLIALCTYCPQLQVIRARIKLMLTSYCL